MRKSDIVTTATIEKHEIVDYLGPVGDRTTSMEKTLASMIAQAELLGANKIIGYRSDWQSPQRFYGYGTAVIAQKIAG